MSSAFAQNKIVFFRINFDHRKWNAQAQLLVEADFDVVDAEALKLKPSKKMNVRSMSVHMIQCKI